MPTSHQSVNAAFSKLEIGLVEGKAKGLIGKHGFTEADLPDIEQVLFMEVFLKRHTLRKWKQRSAGQRTVLSRILDNRVKKMIEAVYADKRRVNLFSTSLAAPVGHNKDGEIITLMDMLDEEGSIGHGQAYVEASPIDLKIELALNTGRLSDLHLDISIYLSEGRSITEIAEILGMRRTTLHHEIKRLRTILAEHGLEDYV